MYISDGGAPPPVPFTTDNPDDLLDATFPVLDTTGSPDFRELQTTAMPYWEVNPTLPSLDWFKAFTGPMINFGSIFEANRQNEPPTHPVNNLNQPIDQNILHRSPGISNSAVLTDGKTGVHTLLDISMYIEKLNSNLKQNNQPVSTGNSCHPFPLCGPDGCSSSGLSFFISFELLLLVLIVFSNVAIITVLRDMANSNKRQFRSSNVFKLSLALADLLLGLSILPAGIQAAISALIDENFDVATTQILSLGSVPGIIFGCGAVIATIVSIWSILMLQFSLFLSIRFPVEQHCGSLLTPKRAKIVTVGIWCLAVGLVICLFPLGFSFGLSPASLTYSPVLLPEAVRNMSEMSITYVEEKYKIPLYASLVWGLPFLLTIPLGIYLVRAIGKACKKLTRRTQASYIKRQPEQIEKRNRLRKDWEAALRILVVELVFVLTFAPSILAHFFYSNSDGCDPRANLAQFIAQFVLVAGSFLNLFVYHLMWKDFKIRLTTLFCGDQIVRHSRNSASSFHSSRTKIQNVEQISPVKSAVIVVTVDSPRSKI